MKTHEFSSKALGILAKVWLNNAVFGRGLTVDISVLEPNGRKRRHVVSALQRCGYLNGVNGDAVTAKAYLEIEPEEPDLIAHLDAIGQMPGVRPVLDHPALEVLYARAWAVPFLDLTFAEQKWVHEHQGYSFWVSSPRDTTPTPVGVPADLNIDQTLWVKTPAYAARHAALCREARIAKLLCTQLPWAVATLGYATHPDAEAFFQTRSAGASEGMFARPFFGHDPDKWPEELCAHRTAAEERLQQAARECGVLAAFERRVLRDAGLVERCDHAARTAADDVCPACGGSGFLELEAPTPEQRAEAWSKFVQRYEERLRAAVTAEGELR